MPSPEFENQGGGFFYDALFVMDVPCGFNRFYIQAKESVKEPFENNRLHA